MIVSAGASGNPFTSSQASYDSLAAAENYAVVLTTRSVMDYVYNSDPQIKERGYAVDDLLTTVSATASTTTSTITITATATNPDDAVLLANDVAKGFQAYIQMQIQQQVDAVRSGLQSQIASYNQDKALWEKKIEAINNNSDPRVGLYQNNVQDDIRTIDLLQQQILQLPSVVTSNVVVIQLASAEDVTSPTKRSLIIAVAGAVGLTIGITIMLLMIFLDDRLRSEEQVKEKLGFAYLGSISNNRQIAANLTQPTGSMKQEFIDVYANLRLTGVLAGQWRAPQGAVLLVTSAQAAEGKTLVATALATATARGGNSVVVVDCSLRQPSTHLAFGMSSTGPGLSGLLRTTGGSIVDAAVQRSNIPGVWLLPAGAPMDDPTLLLEHELPAILAQLRKKVDLIIIDAPSLLSGADASLMATMADGVVFVVDSRHSKLPMLLRAKEILVSWTHKPTGVVLNRFPSRRYNRYYVATLYPSGTTNQKWASTETHSNNGQKPEPAAAMSYSRAMIPTHKSSLSDFRDPGVNGNYNAPPLFPRRDVPQTPPLR